MVINRAGNIHHVSSETIHKNQYSDSVDVLYFIQFTSMLTNDTTTLSEAYYQPFKNTTTDRRSAPQDKLIQFSPYSSVCNIHCTL